MISGFGRREMAAICVGKKCLFPLYVLPSKVVVKQAWQMAALREGVCAEFGPDILTALDRRVKNIEA